MLKEALEQTAQITSRSVLGVLKVPLASEFTIQGKFSCNPALVGHVHSGHIHVFVSFLGSFLLNNTIDK